ncbi:MAG: peptidase C39 family protein [Desulfobacterales bacterium]|nr:peptidase C39 family protein [Desulfobacterales bacterium]
MKKIFFILLSLFIISCSSKFNLVPGYKNNKSPNNCKRINWFPKFESEKMINEKGFWFIKALKGYQQTTEYTCGPAALLALSKFYGLTGIEENKETEMRISREVGTRSMDILKQGGKPGTKPDEMVNWLKKYGFNVKIEFEDKADGSALKKLEENIKKGIPTIVEWAYLTGHWVVVVGYDNRGNDDPWDDVLIFADSYDKFDDYQDGYSFVNANSFYWLWFDLFYFDKITWRTTITAIPKLKP